MKHPIASPVLAFLALLSLTGAAIAQEGPLTNDPPKGISPDQIIQKFADKEKEFKLARDNYTFRQDVKVQTLDGKTVRGEYHETFDVTYDDQHKRLENVVFAPQSTLDQDPSVVVQLVRTDGGPCWGATFSSHLVNDGETFDAKAD